MITPFFYRELSLNSAISRKQAVEALAEVTDSSSFTLRLFETRTELFQGKISETGFEISRIIRYRNSFLPLVKGRFESNGMGGLDIRIVMTLPLFVQFFTWCLLLVAGGFLLYVAYQRIATGHVPPDLVKPTFLTVGIYVAFKLGFEYEVYEATRLLKNILKAEKTEIK
ncbi:hypothetical protein [Larkinella terrae]|uniref:Uncharacterized protein n=1 Tax=Larkinella terrae TaxID=2025311 RepID=A0A7K0ER00_9BACT|nr:hypothetical protein [Larkinella terrae]MRS64219.1 hypothetical protein [Larkinella terrae]